MYYLTEYFAIGLLSLAIISGFEIERYPFIFFADYFFMYSISLFAMSDVGFKSPLDIALL